MKKLFLFITLILFAVVSLAIAADPSATVPEPSAFGLALSGFCTNTLFPIIAALLSGFISWAAMKLGQKYKIESLTTNNNFLTQLAGQGIAFAEEKAANFAKTANPISSNDKLNAAIAYVMQMAPKVTDAQAQSLVTSTLAMLPAVGATGDKTVNTGAIIPPVVLPITPIPPVIQDAPEAAAFKSPLDVAP